MQALSITIFLIYSTALSLGVETVNFFLFFMQFDCVYILISTLTHLGIV